MTTINPDGSRYAIHPADVDGRFTHWRRLVAWLLIAVYVALPWIPIQGAPAVFFDVAERRFYLFGLTILVQDLWLLFFLITGLGFLLFATAALFGRLWCGWACPYTVFLEHVFRRIERLIDGDASARRSLAAAPWSANKLLRRLLKWTLYILCAAAIAHVFLSYFVSLERLYALMREGPLAHFSAFAFVASLSAVLLFCFAWFREQFCIILCPYGRIQSALSDEDTLVIGYDARRGEPRGKASNPHAGHCVDCLRCVQVCPTGIDIRNGLQMECIGCAACIDACDAIMAKLNRPPGLVRYDSARGFAGESRRFLRPRLILYAVLSMMGAAAFFIVMAFKARPYLVELSRLQGPTYFVDATGVRNHFQLRFVNKRNQPVTFTAALHQTPAGLTLSPSPLRLTLGPKEEHTQTLIIAVPTTNYQGPMTFELSIEARPGSRTLHEVPFLGPSHHPSH